MKEAGHRGGTSDIRAAASALRVDFNGGGREEIREGMSALSRLKHSRVHASTVE